MSKDDTHVVFDDHVADVLRAQGYSFEENPRSIYRVEKLYEALSKYAPKTIPAPKPSQDYESGVALARTCFSKPKDQLPLHIMPLTPQTVVDVTSNPSGSPGLTWYGVSKREAQTRALERGLQTIKLEKQPEPCLAFTRTSKGDRTRLIWGYPYSMTVIEGCVAKPLLEMFKGRSTPMAFAMSTCALGTKLVVASYHKRYAYSIDMSQFDATISASLIHKAFCILRTWFNMDEVEPVSGRTVKQFFDLIEKYFIHTTIVMPDGHIYIGKDHGVPSGSYFTQMIDSLVNTIIAGSLSSRFKLHVSRRELFVLGDDLLLWSNRLMSLDTMADYAKSNFHVIMHGSEKSLISKYDEPVHYLGRIWSNGLPSLDVQEIVEKMVYPERHRRYTSDDPERLKREVRMLILSYASVYREGWGIASSLLGADRRNIHCGCANTDVNTFCEGPRFTLDSDMLSGYVRYRMKYLRDGTPKGDIPITAIQYWL
jgi:hypothetical protein